MTLHPFRRAASSFTSATAKSRTRKAPVPQTQISGGSGGICFAGGLSGVLVGLDLVARLYCRVVVCGAPGGG
jgi:hypothetical protein